MDHKRGNPAGASGGESGSASAENEHSQHYRTSPSSSNSLPQPSRSRKHIGTAQSLYSGQDRLGHVLQLTTGWRAFGRRGQPLGLFPNRAEAIDAIGKALREGTR